MLGPYARRAHSGLTTSAQRRSWTPKQLLRSPLPSPAREVPLSPELHARIDRAHDEARSGSFAQLNPANRARVEGLIDAVLGGRTTLYDAGMAMASALSGAEANALLAQHDATERALRSNWAGMEHPDPQVEAGRYIMDIGLSQEQRRTLATMRQSR